MRIIIVTRSTNTMAPLGQLFGVSLETVLENEASGFLVPLLVKLCIQVVMMMMIIMIMVIMMMMTMMIMMMMVIMVITVMTMMTVLKNEASG